MVGDPLGGTGGVSASEAAQGAEAGHGGLGTMAPGDGGVGPVGGGSPTAVGVGGAAVSTGGAGGTGGTGGAGGTGGDPLVCDASGAKNCSASPDPTCPDGAVSPGHFTSQVGAAVQYVRDLPANAGRFDYDGQFPCCPKVGTGTEADKVWFRDAVLDRLNTYADLCAQADYGNHPHEIAVKRNNKCSEGYIVLTSAGVVRSPPKRSYTCVPAGH